MTVKCWQGENWQYTGKFWEKYIFGTPCIYIKSIEFKEKKRRNAFWNIGSPILDTIIYNILKILIKYKQQSWLQALEWTDGSFYELILLSASIFQLFNNQYSMKKFYLENFNCTLYTFKFSIRKEKLKKSVLLLSNQTGRQYNCSLILEYVN